jgi:hypothetical protein
MKTTLTLILSMATVVVNAQTMLWAGAQGGTANDNINSMVTDASGNVYTTGKLEGTMDFDPGAGVFNLTASGTTDVFVCKMDVSGNLLWAKQMGSDYPLPGEEGTGIAVSASGSIYVTGAIRDTADMDPGAGVFNLITDAPCTPHPHTDIFILKLTADGDFVWAGQVGGKGYDHPKGICLGIDDAIHLTGDFTMINIVGYPRIVDMDPGPGEYIIENPNGAAYVLKLDSSGNFLWVDAYRTSSGSVVGCAGLNGNMFSNAIAVDGSGNIYTTGFFGSTGDFDPGAGTYSLTPSGGMNAYILKLNSDGGFVWARHFTGGSCYGNDVTVDGSGNVYTTGQFANTVDFNPGSGTNNMKAPGSPGTANAFVSKLNASGNYVWAMQLGGNSNDYGNSIDLDESGNVYTTGSFAGTGDFNPGSAKYNLTSAGGSDAFVSKLNSSGSFLWAVRLGGTADDGGKCIDIDASNNVLTAGTFNGTADFNPGTGTYNLTSAGGADAYIHKMTPGASRMEDANGDMENITAYVFPNPASEQISVSAGGFEGSVEITLVNALGQTFSTAVINAGEGTHTMDISSLAPGIYFVRIKTEYGDVYEKFIKQ